MRALFLLALPVLLSAQTPVRTAAGGADSLKTAPVVAQAAGDTAKVKSPPPMDDSLAAARAKSRKDSVIVVKHSFNHREQIITGSVIMTCLALMLVSMNNYNPR